MGKLLTTIIIIAVIVVAVVLLTNRGTNDTSVSPPPAKSGPPPSEEPKKPALNTGFHGADLTKIPADATVIKITGNGFSPNKITAKKGVTVYFANEDSETHWPATAIHPTHRVYPDSDINDCNTGKAKNMFDACRGIKPGEFWAFTFGEAGLWRFHEHLNPTLTGAITVE